MTQTFDATKHPRRPDGKFDHTAGGPAESTDVDLASVELDYSGCSPEFATAAEAALPRDYNSMPLDPNDPGDTFNDGRHDTLINRYLAGDQEPLSEAVLNEPGRNEAYDLAEQDALRGILTRMGRKDPNPDDLTAAQYDALTARLHQLDSASPVSDMFANSAPLPMAKQLGEPLPHTDIRNAKRHALLVRLKGVGVDTSQGSIRETVDMLVDAGPKAWDDKTRFLATWRDNPDRWAAHDSEPFEETPDRTVLVLAYGEQRIAAPLNEPITLTVSENDPVTLNLTHDGKRRLF